MIYSCSEELGVSCGCLCAWRAAVFPGVVPVSAVDMTSVCLVHSSGEARHDFRAVLSKTELEDDPREKGTREVGARETRKRSGLIKRAHGHTAPLSAGSVWWAW